MESINLQPEDRMQLLVLPLGFEEAVIEKLKSIFQLSKSSEHDYAMTANTKTADILLVNYDNPSAVQQKETLLAGECQHAQVVALSHGPLAEPPNYHIRGILTAVRLLSLLDKLPLPERNDNAVASARSVANSNVIPLNANTSNIKNVTGYRALIVDDSVAIQRSIELRLQELPQITAIEFADDGETALAKVASGYYDLIFLDVMMPGIDGYQTCTEIRKDARYKKTPIIMVSGKSSPLDEVKGIIAGCTTYLIKPIQEDAFHKLSVRVLAWLAEQRNVNNETAAC
ncbi:MAG: response regulator [Methylococcaceae bacterium]